jgi:GMP synthase (glutamine-hydrolysing)
MRVHYVIHEAFEAPGAFQRWRESRGLEATYSRVHEHQALPDSAGDIDLLVVMGGPQSPSTEVDPIGRTILRPSRFAMGTAV